MLPPEKLQRRLAPVKEAQLVQRLRARDRSAQGEVVRRYHLMLLRLAFSVLHQWALAEDAVQDTWIVAFANIERFEGRSMLRTWLSGIVINQARRYQRQRRRSPPLSAVETPASSSLPEPVNEVTAERMVLEQEWTREVEAALRKLPVTQRSVLLLQLRGCTSAETTSTLRISEVARRVRLSRARARLRKVFRWDVRGCSEQLSPG